MIIFSGLGFLVPIIGFGTLILVQYFAGQITGNEEYYQKNEWVRVLGIVLAALLIYILDQLLHRKVKRLSDAEDVEEILKSKTHSLFFIPLKWWPLIIIVLGAYLLFID